MIPILAPYPFPGNIMDAAEQAECISALFFTSILINIFESLIAFNL
jgi:hypothetical protein